MTPELTAIPGVGIALASLIRQGLRGVNGRIDRVGSALGSRIDRVGTGLREIRDRLSRLEGRMDFLEGCIVRRNEHPGAPAE